MARPYVVLIRRTVVDCNDKNIPVYICAYLVEVAHQYSKARPIIETRRYDVELSPFHHQTPTRERPGLSSATSPSTISKKDVRSQSRNLHRYAALGGPPVGHRPFRGCAHSGCFRGERTLSRRVKWNGSVSASAKLTKTIQWKESFHSFRESLIFLLTAARPGEPTIPPLRITAKSASAGANIRLCDRRDLAHPSIRQPTSHPAAAQDGSRGRCRSGSAARERRTINQRRSATNQRGGTSRCA